MSFDWHSEEGQSWADEPEGHEGGRRLRRRLFLALALLLAIGGVSAFLLLQLGQQAEEVTEDEREAVLASFYLVRQAAESRDAELLSTFLSGRDPRWSAAQEALVRHGGLWDRPGLGLNLLPGGSGAGLRPRGSLTVTEVTVSADLTEAEVVAEQRYSTAIGSGISGTVRLRHDAVYRLGPDRWLYAPPEDPREYWGEWMTRTGRLLTVVYPERDRHIVLRLAADLEKKLAAVCGSYQGGCSFNAPIQMRLSDDPQILTTVLERGQIVHAAGAEIVLPTPTLAGMPVDQAAYEALYRGYATHLLGTVLTHYVWQWQCCEHRPFFQAVLDQELVRLGLKAWPVMATDYASRLEDEARLSSMIPLWESEKRALPDDLGGHMVVEFLLWRDPGATPTLLASMLNFSGNYWTWLQQVNGGPILTQTLHAQWQTFISQKAAAVITS